MKVLVKSAWGLTTQLKQLSHSYMPMPWRRSDTRSRSSCSVRRCLWCAPRSPTRLSRSAGRR